MSRAQLMQSSSGVGIDLQQENNTHDTSLL